MCSSRKYTYPEEAYFGNLKGKDGFKSTIFSRLYDAKLEFLERGGGFKPKKPPWGEWIFS